MKVLLISPGILNPADSGGGTPFFRALAGVISRVFPTVATDPRSSGLLDSQLEVACARTRGEIISLMKEIRPAVIFKASGALFGEDDLHLDLALGDIHRTTSTTVVYVDVDAPSRIPLLWFQPEYHLSRLAAVGVLGLIIGGGPRALHSYRALGFDHAILHDAAFVYEGVQALAPAEVGVGGDSETNTRPVDVASLISLGDARCEREAALLNRAKLSGLTCVSGLNITPADDDFVTPRDWHKALMRSRFCLNLLREDVRGFSDVPSARIFEAVHAGSVLLSEDFDGLSWYTPRPYRVDLPKAQAEWDTLATLTKPVTDSMAQSARVFMEKQSFLSSHRLERTLRRLLES
jgi:hypothetical protein